jgi:dTDP-4-dehydrorhamnose 3,5-epimerase
MTIDMQITQTEIADVLMLSPRRFEDGRGLFAEVYNAQALADYGVKLEFIQDNHAFNALSGTLRGLHFQNPPYQQAKLVRCVRGAILDVAVDLRPKSPTFGRHVAKELSEDNWHQLLIPEGFAHGYLTLTDSAVVLYKVNRPYAPDHQGGILWNDPDLKISWGQMVGSSLTIAEKDQTLPRLRDLTSHID